MATKTITVGIPTVLPPPLFILPAGTAYDPVGRQSYYVNGQRVFFYLGVKQTDWRITQDWRRANTLPFPGEQADPRVLLPTNMAGVRVGQPGGSPENGGMKAQSYYTDGTIRNVRGEIINDPGPRAGASRPNFQPDALRGTTGAALPANDPFTVFRIQHPELYDLSTAQEVWEAYSVAGIDPFAIQDDLNGLKEFTATITDRTTGGVNQQQLQKDVILQTSTAGRNMDPAYSAPVDQTALLDPRYTFVPPATPSSRDAAGGITSADIAAMTPFTTGGGTQGYGGNQPVLLGPDGERADVVVGTVPATGDLTQTLATPGAVATAAGAAQPGGILDTLPEWVLPAAALVALVLLTREK